MQQSEKPEKKLWLKILQRHLLYSNYSSKGLSCDLKLWFHLFWLLIMQKSSDFKTNPQFFLFIHEDSIKNFLAWSDNYYSSGYVLNNSFLCLQ